MLDFFEFITTHTYTKGLQNQGFSGISDLSVCVSVTQQGVQSEAEMAWRLRERESMQASMSKVEKEEKMTKQMVKNKKKREGASSPANAIHMFFSLISLPQIVRQIYIYTLIHMDSVLMMSGQGYVYPQMHFCSCQGEHGKHVAFCISDQVYDLAKNT